MSRHWYSYQGYGIYVDNLYSCTKEGLSNIIELCDDVVKKDAKEAVYEITANKEYDIDSIVNDLESYEFGEWGNSGIAALFTNAIETQEHINLCNAYADEDHCILFEPWYPWQRITDEEKSITPKKLNEIFRKYQVLLGIPEDKIEKAEYQDIVGYC